MLIKLIKAISNILSSNLCQDRYETDLLLKKQTEKVISYGDHSVKRRESHELHIRRSRHSALSEEED